MFYATASIDSNGNARFAADMYGRDPKLVQALASCRSTVVASLSGRRIKDV